MLGEPRWAQIQVTKGARLLSVGCVQNDVPVPPVRPLCTAFKQQCCAGSVERVDIKQGKLYRPVHEHRARYRHPSKNPKRNITGLIQLSESYGYTVMPVHSYLSGKLSHRSMFFPSLMGVWGNRTAGNAFSLAEFLSPAGKILMCKVSVWMRHPWKLQITFVIDSSILTIERLKNLKSKSLRMVPVEGHIIRISYPSYIPLWNGDPLSL